MNQHRINYLKKVFPVRQDKHTGKYGFERVMDCFNLRRAVYPTRRQAELARMNWIRCVTSDLTPN